MKKTIKFTTEGYEEMEKRNEKLLKERTEVIVRLQTAREMGDLSENGAYKAARFELGSIDRELRKLSYLLRSADVIKKTSKSGIIEFGSKVKLKNNEKLLEFMLVEDKESNPSKQKLSIQSPIGKAILGKKAGDTVKVSAPAGTIIYTIEAIS